MARVASVDADMVRSVDIGQHRTYAGSQGAVASKHGFTAWFSFNLN
jgi:hypothetical protein